MEKSPGPGLFIDFTDLWSLKEVKEERSLPFIFKNTQTTETLTTEEENVFRRRRHLSAGAASAPSAEGLALLPEGRFYDRHFLGATAR